MNEQQRKGRRTLLLIAALFFAPILLAVALYFSGTDWRPAASTVRGELITPPISLPETALTAEGGEQFREVWSMVVRAEDHCDASCVEALEHIRQIRLSLGPKMYRIQTVLLPASDAAVISVDRQSHPALIIADPEWLVPVSTLIGPWRNGEILLVDPFGNLMMRYAPDTEMADVRKDLGHLLNLSTIG